MSCYSGSRGWDHRPRLNSLTQREASPEYPTSRKPDAQQAEPQQKHKHMNKSIVHFIEAVPAVRGSTPEELQPPVATVEQRLLPSSHGGNSKGTYTQWRGWDRTRDTDKAGVTASRTRMSTRGKHTGSPSPPRATHDRNLKSLTNLGGATSDDKRSQYQGRRPAAAPPAGGSGSRLRCLGNSPGKRLPSRKPAPTSYLRRLALPQANLLPDKLSLNLQPS